VKAVLLYGCETWKVTNLITQKLQSFINCCPRGILNVRWPEVISNIILWGKTEEKPIELQIKKENGSGLGILLRRIQMQLKGLCWIGTHRARGREEDQNRPGRGQLWKRQRKGRTWREVKWLAADRSRWMEMLRGSPLLLQTRQ
jgi:hypothetical protein